MMLDYPLTLTPDDNGTFLVTCPLLPEVTTFGDDEADARRQGKEAIEEAIGARMSRWDDVPVPDGSAYNADATARLSLQADLKLHLMLACKEAEVSRAELARRLQWHREQVDRLFRLDHASRIDQIEAALGALNKVVGISVEAA